MLTPGSLPSICPRCQASLGCGIQDGSCWCQQLPSLKTPLQLPATSCLCPACLQALLDQQQQAHLRERP